MLQHLNRVPLLYHLLCKPLSIDSSLDTVSKLYLQLNIRYREKLKRYFWKTIFVQLGRESNDAFVYRREK